MDHGATFRFESRGTTPQNLGIVIPRASTTDLRRACVGSAQPLSHCDTAALVTPTLRASAA
jgi:hypothetical protein